jgi:hypothetical protein
MGQKMMAFTQIKLSLRRRKLPAGNVSNSRVLFAIRSTVYSGAGDGKDG